MNKKQTGIFEQWLKSQNARLTDCYKRPSHEKLEAEHSIIRQCRSLEGKRFRILSYNTFTFTCAFAAEKDGKTMLVWHSPYKTDAFFIPVEWEEV